MDSQTLENETEKSKRQREASKSVKKPTTLTKSNERQNKISSTGVNLERRVSKQPSNLQIVKSKVEITNKSSANSLKLKTSTTILKDKTTINNVIDKKTSVAPSNFMKNSTNQDLSRIKKSNNLIPALNKISGPKLATSSNNINKQKTTDHSLEKTSTKPQPPNIKSQKKVTNTLMISKKTKLLDEKSPRTKVSNSNNEKYNLNSKNNRRNVPTNVTVNSPKHNRKVISSASLLEDDSNPSFNVFMTRTNEIPIENLNQGIEPPVDEDKDDKIKHKRFRTRTLEPEEIKLIKKGEGNSSNDIKMKNLVKNFVMNDQHVPLIGKPKAFYVNLDESESTPDHSSTKLATKVVKKLSPAHSESDSINYEDDFESYESDFESFDSSSHKEPSSESKSLSPENSESISLSHNMSNDNDSFSLKRTSTNEEINLDSGNYDYREIKSGNSYQLKMGDIKETALEIKHFPYTYENTKVNDSTKQMSYTDEGFDENSGGFSSTSNSGYSKPQDIINNNKDNSVHLTSRPKSKKMTLMQYYQQRARDLCSLITLDEIKYSLFEVNPVPYDVFMKTFGKSNFFQGSSQTNDDYVDEDTQTDSILTANKWTQNPIDYSKYDIVTSVISEKQSKFKKNIFDPKIHNDIYDLPTKDNGSIEIKLLENPLEIFTKQRVGSNIDFIGLSKDGAQNVLTDHKMFSKYYLFVQNTGKMMSDYLEAESSEFSKRDVFKSDLKISNSYFSPLKNLHKINYLEKRPVQMASFSDDDCNCFVTMHSRMSSSESITPTSALVGDFISSRTLICIWCFKSNVPAEPTKILTCIGDVSCCKVFGGISGIAVAGLSDGTISVWDLKEDDAWHNLDRISTDGLKNLPNTSTSLSNHKEIPRKEITVENPVLRCSSFNSCHIDFKPNHDSWAGPVEDILFVKAKKLHDYSDNQQLPENTTISYDQLCSLQKYGLLTIWTIINQITSSSDSMEEMNSKTFVDHHSSPYWAKLTLHKSLVINMTESIDIENGTSTSSMNTLTPEAKDVLYPSFPLTDVHRRNSLKKTFSLKDLEAIKKSHLTAQKKRNAIVGKINSIISDPSLRNMIFGDVEIDADTNIEEANTELQLKLNEKSTDVGPVNWQIGLICSMVRYIQDFNDEGHFLVACNAGKVAHYLQRGYIRDPSIFFCSDNASTVNAIEVCPHGLLYFLVSCDDHSIYLCSLTNERPLKTFFNQHGITELVLQQNDIEKYQREEIICVQWSHIRPCLFIALSRKGRLTVWDLMKSDLVPILIEKLNAGSDTSGDRAKEIKLSTVADAKNGHKKELLMLIFTSGKIEIHTLHEDLYLSNINGNQERLILAKYFELL